MNERTSMYRICALALLPFVTWLAGTWLTPVDTVNTAAMVARALLVLTAIHAGLIGLLLPAAIARGYRDGGPALVLVPLPLYLLIVSMYGAVAAHSTVSFLLLAAWCVLLGRVTAAMVDACLLASATWAGMALPLLQAGAVTLPWWLIWQLNA